MQLCEEVANGLSSRGHEIAVLTSTYGQRDPSSHRYPVYRALTIDPDWRKSQLTALRFFVGRKRRERRTIAIFRRLVNNFEPDIVFIWHPMGLPREMLRVAEKLAHSVAVFYLADYWPELPDEYIAYWEKPPAHPIARRLKGILAQIALHMLASEGKPVHLDLAHAICVSDYVRQRLTNRGLLPATAVTIHNGIDVARFSPPPSVDAQSTDTFKCLVAGRLVPEKGVHTVIEALALLQDSDNTRRLTLTVLGSGSPPYVEMLKRKVISCNLDKTVTFLSSIPREQMPDLLRKHDVLIASAEYDEPLARMVQEAMGCGLVVVGTTTGGSAEILTHKVNGLTFVAGDAADLAQQLKRLLAMSMEHRKRLAQAGIETVRASFDIEQTIAQVEAYLLNLPRYAPDVE